MLSYCGGKEERDAQRECVLAELDQQVRTIPRGVCRMLFTSRMLTIVGELE